MSNSKSWNKALKDIVDRLAQQLAWNDLSEKDKEKYLKKAQKQEDKRLKELALKCVREANKAMSEPGYVSRADPDVYINKK